MNEVIAILDASTASPEVKLKAFQLAVEIAGPIAVGATKGQAGGEWLTFLMELLKMLLPILLQLLVPKV